MFLHINCISHISGYTCTQFCKWVSWIRMEKHILWKIKHWFSIAFVKLTILEVGIKYWFLFKYEELKHWVPKQFRQFQENHQFQNFLQYSPCSIRKKNAYHTALFEVCITLINKVHFYLKNINPTSSFCHYDYFYSP